MIVLTRLGGLPMAVNPDLIERAEQTPDTVITMIGGHKHVVLESVTEVVAMVRDWRASVAAEALALSHATAGDDARSPAEDAAQTDAASRLSSPLAPVLRLTSRED